VFLGSEPAPILPVLITVLLRSGNQGVFDRRCARRSIAWLRCEGDRCAAFVSLTPHPTTGAPASGGGAAWTGARSGRVAPWFKGIWDL
jgi:hypothetical protein